MSDADDARAFATYDEASNREPVPGPSRGRAPGGATLSEYVPIRLSADAMEAVRRCAHAESLTVSAWVRRLIERELARSTDDDPAAAVAQAIETLEGVRRSLDEGSAVRSDVAAGPGKSRSGARGRAEAKRRTG